MLKVACVGLGWWSDELAKAVDGRDNKLRIVGGAARTPAKRAAFVERLGVRPYDSYEAVLGDSEIEGVILTTPHSLHADHVIAAAKAGKHVFVEKPFTLTAASAATAAEVCRRAGVVLAVGHNRRFSPAAVELKRLVDAGILGTILHAEANFSAPSALNYTPERWRASGVESPAGGLAGLGIHMIDALIWLLGPMDRTICQARRLALTVDIDDTTSALIDFKAGYTGYLGTMCAAPILSICACSAPGRSLKPAATSRSSKFNVQAASRSRFRCYRSTHSVRNLKPLPTPAPAVRHIQCVSKRQSMASRSWKQWPVRPHWAAPGSTLDQMDRRRADAERKEATEGSRSLRRHA